MSAACQGLECTRSATRHIAVRVRTRNVTRHSTPGPHSEAATQMEGETIQLAAISRLPQYAERSESPLECHMHREQDARSRACPTKKPTQQGRASAAPTRQVARSRACLSLNCLRCRSQRETVGGVRNCEWQHALADSKGEK